jgi:hypothetical protein
MADSPSTAVLPRFGSLSDFLSPEEINQAVVLYRITPPGTFAMRCEAEIIRPALPRINDRLGQRCEPRFIAYGIEFLLLNVKRMKA